MVKRCVFFVALALLCAPVAGAKHFEPGDLRICDREGCVEMRGRAGLKALGDFIYLDPRPPVRVPPPGGRALLLELRFDNGFVAAVVGGGLDRIRVHGIYCERFRRGRWYRLPRVAAHEVRRLAGRLAPIRSVARAVPRSC